MFGCIVVEKEEISGVDLEEAFNALVHIWTYRYSSI